MIFKSWVRVKILCPLQTWTTEFIWINDFVQMPFISACIWFSDQCLIHWNIESLPVGWPNLLALQSSLSTEIPKSHTYAISPSCPQKPYQNYEAFTWLLESTTPKIWHTTHPSCIRSNEHYPFNHKVNEIWRIRRQN